MRLPRPITVSVVTAVSFAFAPALLQAQKNAPRPGVRQVQPRAQNPKAARADNRPGEQILRGLRNMTPEERERALSKLPPARRAQIEKRIQNFESLPPAQQERRLDRLERLNSLAPRRQTQVRRSMQDLNALPDDRRKAVNQELRRMTNLTDEDRQAHMNTENFRNKFSPAEQEMIGNLNELLPSKE